MSIVEIRNKIVKLLWAYLGQPVILSGQVQPEPDLPYCVYTVITPYAPIAEMGDYTVEPTEEGGQVEYRREMPSATFSFTFCSANRRGPDGVEIIGADEAEALAEKAIGYFLHVGYNDLSKIGITIVDVGQAQDRTTLDIDEAARRVGFDVRIRYTRTDTREVPAADTSKITIKGAQI